MADNQDVDDYDGMCEMFNETAIEFIQGLIPVMPENMKATYRLIVKALKGKTASDPTMLLNEWNKMASQHRPLAEIFSLATAKPLLLAMENHDQLKELQLHNPTVLKFMGKTVIANAWKTICNLDKQAESMQNANRDQFKIVGKLVPAEFIERIAQGNIDPLEIGALMLQLSANQEIRDAFSVQPEEEEEESEEQAKITKEIEERVFSFYK